MDDEAGGAFTFELVKVVETDVGARVVGAKGLVRLEEVRGREVDGYDDVEGGCDCDCDCDRGGLESECDCDCRPARDAPEEAAVVLGSPYMSRDACSTALRDPMRGDDRGRRSR